MQRYLEARILKDLESKIVLLSGPRQVGKTTLSRRLYPNSTEYFNMDNQEHRLIIKKDAWKKDCALVVFDELHKIKHWKRWIKGIYDTQGVRPRLFVTGSARLDIYRKGGDSLAGRFFSYRLHPISIAEVKNDLAPQEALERIMKVGGFPEPFIQQTEDFAKRWRHSHIDSILKEDLLDVSVIKNVRGIETLVEILRSSVGTVVNYESLARDLEVSSHTIKQWINLLESLFIIFTVRPYSKNVRRSLLKQPKIYFYDTGYIKEDEGVRLENAVACALLKRLNYLEDSQGVRCQLCCLRDRQKREVDFLIVKDNVPEKMIEVKNSDVELRDLRYFSGFFPPGMETVLLVRNLSREQDHEHIKVRKASIWLSQLEA